MTRPAPDAPGSNAPPGSRADAPALPEEVGPAASRRVRERDATLAGDGWERRFIGGPPRLEEMVELYRSLGHEVRTETLEDGDLEDRCAGCALALSLFRIVYTRPQS